MYSLTILTYKSNNQHVALCCLVKNLNVVLKQSKVDAQEQTTNANRLIAHYNSLIKNSNGSKSNLMQKQKSYTAQQTASYENVLYFVVSKGLNDKIYGKFGNYKAGNEKQRFAAYNTTNPSYEYASLLYNQNILPNQNMCLDNYINDRVLLKTSALPKVDFKRGGTGGRKRDWFDVSEDIVNDIWTCMKTMKSIDNEADLMKFTQTILGLIGRKSTTLKETKGRVVCNTCKESKLPSAFNVHQAKCKECQKVYNERKYQEYKSASGSLDQVLEKSKTIDETKEQLMQINGSIEQVLEKSKAIETKIDALHSRCKLLACSIIVIGIFERLIKV